MGLRKGSWLRAALMLCLMAAAWFLLAPPVIGGATTYTITTGDSMEPLLHDGDLAVVREVSDYEVGDVVAYKSDALGRTVLHRIVGQDGSGFVFKGDHNDFLDPEQPGSDQLIGSLWFHVPKLGVGFTAVRSPIGLGVAALVMMSLVSGMFATSRRRSKGRHRAHRKDPTPAPAPAPTMAQPPEAATTAQERPALRVPPKPPPPPPARRETGEPPSASRWALSNRAQRARSVALVSLVLALAFGGGAMYMRTQPSTLIGSDDAQYTHSGAFSYSAPVSDSPAYDGPVLTTGEPIFLKVVDQVVVEYRYTFDSEADHDVALDGGLVARLSAGNGLRRTVLLDTQTEEGADALTLTAPLVLDEIKNLVRAIEKETGIDQSAYTVTIAAQVQLGGAIADRPIDDGFTSDMELRLDGLQLSAPFTPEGTIAKETFATSKTAAVEREEERPNDLVIGDRHIRFATLERAAWVGSAVAVVVLVAALLLLIFFSPRDDANRINAKYRSLIVPIKEAPGAEVDTVDVPDIDTLVRLAEQFEQVILHEASEKRHTYIVSHDGFLYRYTVRAQSRTKAAAG